MTKNKETYDSLGRRIVPSTVAQLMRQIAEDLLGHADDLAASYAGDRLIVRYDGDSWDEHDIMLEATATLTVLGVPGASCFVSYAYGAPDLIVTGLAAPLEALTKAARAVYDSAARGTVAYLEGTEADYTGALAALACGTEPELDRTARGRRVEHYRGAVQVTETHRAKWWVTVIGGIEPVVSAVAL